MEKRPNSAGLLLPAAPGAAPLSPQRPSATAGGGEGSRGNGRGGSEGERSVAASFLPNDSDWRPDRATLPSSTNGSRRRGSSGNGLRSSSTSSRNGSGLTPRLAALSRDVEGSSSDLPRNEGGGWQDAKDTASSNNGSSKPGASSKQSWATNTATAAAATAGVLAAPAPDGKKVAASPPIRDWCTPTEARRRLGAARQAKWRSGMSDAQHQRVRGKKKSRGYRNH